MNFEIPEWVNLADGVEMEVLAMVHDSTIADFDHTHASHVDTHFAHRFQVASQGTRAVNIRYAGMAMH